MKGSARVQGLGFRGPRLSNENGDPRFDKSPHESTEVASHPSIHKLELRHPCLDTILVEVLDSELSCKSAID